jgi:hypothetical protein
VISTEVWNWVVDLVAKTLGLVLVLSATSRGADWIRLGVSINLLLSLNLEIVIWSKVPCAVLTFLIFQVLKGITNIWVNCLVEVVENWIIWIILGPIPLMAELFFGEVQTLFALVDQVISTEVWYEVVDLVAKTLLFMLVLSAASRRANWIRLSLSVSFRVELDIRVKLNILDNPFMSKNFFSIIKVLHGANDITVKSWVVVIQNLLGWIGPFFFGSSSTNLEFVTNHTFSSFQGCEVVVDIVVSAKVWNWVVNFITKFLLLMLILSATSGGADWIGLRLSYGINVGISLNKRWQLVRWPGVLRLVVVDLVFINRRKDPGTITVLLDIPFTVFGLRVGNVLLGESDILILTEVWNKIVPWWSIWCW